MQWSYDAQKLFPTTMLRLGLGIALALVTVVGRVLLLGNAALADAYAGIMKIVMMILSGASSYVGVVIGQWLIVGAILGVMVYLITQIAHIASHPGRLARLGRMGANVFLIWMLFLCGSLLLNGYSYGCTAAHVQMGLTVGDNYTAQDLYEAAVVLREEADALSDTVPRGTTGSADYGEFSDTAKRVAESFTTLSAEYPFLQSTYAPAKDAKWQSLMTRSGLTGRYFALTGECCVNTRYPQSVQPYLAAQMMAKRMGVAEDAESSFVAYLACAASDDRRVQYAGKLAAFRLCYMVLNRSDEALATELLSGAGNQLIFDLQELGGSFSVSQNGAGLYNAGQSLTRLLYGQPSASESDVTLARLYIAEFKQESEMEKYQED